MSVREAAAAATTADVRVITYNLLSPELSEPLTFPENTPEECDGKNRLPRILIQLEQEILNHSIIALQEVSITWLGPLHELFDRHNYHYTHTLYGGWYSGYMGVGLAFPRELYSLSTLEIKRIAETKNWPKLTPKTRSNDKGSKDSVVVAASPGIVSRSWNYSTGYLRNVLDPLFVLGGYAFGSSSKDGEEETKSKSSSKDVKKEDPPDIATFYRAKKRANQAIFERLCRRSDGRMFCVANYHNPCEISMRPIITLHAVLYVEKAQQFASGNPLIVCGDFNMQPDSGGYELVTTGQLDRFHPEYPLLPSKDPWRPTLTKMESAYHVANGVEPVMTNKAVRLIGKWGAEPNAFAGTLDYIFISKGMKVKDTVPLPSDDDMEAVSWPTAVIPSDHLMLGASLQLPELCEEESKL